MGVEVGARRDLLIGIGNPLRGDDGVAALLLEELAEEWPAKRLAVAELQVVHQLTPELAAVVAGARRVLFVDACVAPQTVEPWIERLDPLEAQPASEGGAGRGSGSLGSHQLAPATLLALANLLFGWRGEGALLRVPAFAFPHGPRLSPPLERALPRARHLLRQWLREG
jgi:hydrogenase maturation protease